VKRRPTLARRLVAWFAIAVIALLASLGLALDRAIEQTLQRDLDESLQAEARAVQRTLPEDDRRLQPEIRSLGAALELRITVILEDGSVVADSERDPATMANQAMRPEVRAAIAGMVGIDSRIGGRVAAYSRHVALPPREGRIVRVALPLSVVQSRLERVRTLIVVGSFLAALVGVLVVYLLARLLTRPVQRMAATVTRMSEGDLGARVAPERTAELALLADVVNRLAADLEGRLDEIQRDRGMRDSILSAMDEGIVLVEAEHVRYVNPAARRLLNGRPEELRGIAPLGIVRVVHEARERHQAATAEVETAVPSRILQVTAVPIDGHEQVLLVLRDVTGTRRVEAMRRDFVADASHELKTPVAAIQAAAETVRAAVVGDPEAARRFSEQIHRDAVRLSRLVSDLLDLSRLETRAPDLAPVRLGALVRSETERLSDRFHQADVRVTVEVAADPIVEGDAEDLRLLARNLLENAARYTPAGGEVRVEVGDKDGTALLVVADTGVGIPSRDLPRVFERFYRVDRARSRETGGTGLGLAIAKHVAEQHGGRIEVDSELGRGSTFRVELPVAEVTGVRGRPPTSPPPP